MTRELTAFEVLQIAEQMERDAVKFYRKAARMYHDPSMSKLFSELAQWEKRHVQVFAQMKDRFAEQGGEGGRFDLGRMAVSHLEIPSAVFNEYSDPAKELHGNEAREDVFRLALKKERYTIGYYTSLTEFALGQDNIKAINSILQEEKKHVKMLAQSLKQASG